jgi:hypothetical protein
MQLKPSSIRSSLALLTLWLPSEPCIEVRWGDLVEDLLVAGVLRELDKRWLRTGFDSKNII